MESKKVILDKFLRYLEQERRYSKHTVLAYGRDVNDLSDYLRSVFDVSDLSECNSIMARSWMVSLSEQGLTAKSINRKLSSVKSFYQFCLRMEVIQNHPFSRLSGLKLPKRLPQYLKQEEVTHLMERLDFDDTWQGLRDRLILFLLYECGLRRAELIDLKVSSIDEDRKQITVMGKGSKERILPLSEGLLSLYHAYLLERDKEVVSNWLFVTKKGKPFYPKAVYNIVTKYIGQVSTLKKKGPHTLRHTFATHLTNEGAEIKAIQELLGHASLAATQVYTHNSVEKLKRAYSKAHPKA